MICNGDGEDKGRSRRVRKREEKRGEEEQGRREKKTEGLREKKRGTEGDKAENIRKQ